MREHPECKKPSDAIHLATALALNVDEMHTYDQTDLLDLSERVMRADGIPLKICNAYALPRPAPVPVPSSGVSPRQESLPLTAPDEPEQDENK